MTVVCMTSITMHALILKSDERPLSWSQITWEDFIDSLIKKDYHANQESVHYFDHKIIVLY